MSEVFYNLGETIRQARIKKGYTQEKFSEILEISHIHLANIEGSRRCPSVALLFRMMELLDFSVDALVFHQEKQDSVLHTNGLTEREVKALSNLIDAIRAK